MRPFANTVCVGFAPVFGFVSAKAPSVPHGMNWSRWLSGSE
jgi:hypothetical protein